MYHCVIHFFAHSQMASKIVIKENSSSRNDSCSLQHSKNSVSRPTSGFFQACQATRCIPAPGWSLFHSVQTLLC